MRCTTCARPSKDRVEKVDVSGEECPSPNSDYQGPCQGCKDLAEVDVQIAQARALLLNLRLKRCDAKRRRNQHHGRLVRQLPVEVISRIFVHCLPPRSPLSGIGYMGYLKSRCPKLHTMPPALVMASVCQRWRQIALATLRLWSVAVMKIEEMDVAAQAEMTADWLSRSGALPLSLEIHQIRPEPSSISSSPYARKPPDLTPIFEAVDAHISRLVRLELHIDARLPSPLRGEALMLRELHLDVRKDYDDKAVVFSAETKPSPQRVVLHSIWPRAVNINWTVVTFFETLSLWVDGILDLFEQTPQLVECRIAKVINPLVRLPDETRHVTLPYLETLLLDQGSLEQIGLLNHLTTPFLKTVKTEAHPESISQFITRSKCGLDHLLINALDGTPEDLIELLKKTPYLTDLEIRDGNIDEVFLEHLAPASPMEDGLPATPEILPRLHRLRLTGVPYFKWSSIPHIFSPKKENDNLVSRPLHCSFELTFTDEDGGTPRVIPEDVESRLKDLRAQHKVMIHAGYHDLLYDY
ncbi:hypothetical protein NLJ89_g10395 [Agrocybe chaxingu]|uniref:F-box domain-containing protein n=1 Tax=Agrocybe chaxingu TaxID=84603 RepID=A0A9W8JQP3_9AGAR|nr:hypothetical protein NLJ89_g10395 [Agrocybe chaxingu]